MKHSHLSITSAKKETRSLSVFSSKHAAMSERQLIYLNFDYLYDNLKNKSKSDTVLYKETCEKSLLRKTGTKKPDDIGLNSCQIALGEG